MRKEANLVPQCIYTQPDGSINVRQAGTDVAEAIAKVMHRSHFSIARWHVSCEETCEETCALADVLPTSSQLSSLELPDYCNGLCGDGTNSIAASGCLASAIAGCAQLTRLCICW
jgi:hypothetical protein